MQVDLGVVDQPHVLRAEGSVSALFVSSFRILVTLHSFGASLLHLTLEQSGIVLT